MVALADLPRANQLDGEAQQISNALAAFERGGVILAMTVGPPPPPEQAASMPRGVQVNTATMSVPPGMLDTIRQNLLQRQGEIATELQQLGVTGVGAGR